MSYRRVSQIVLVVLTGVLLACGGDNVLDLTEPDLSGLTNVTAGAKGGKGGGGGNGSISTCDTYSPGAVTGDGDRYCDSQPHVSSEVSSNGNHVLNTTKSGRVLKLDFSGGCVQGACSLPDAFDGSQTFSAEVSLGSWLNELPEGFLSMEPGGARLDHGMVLNFRFDIGRKDVLHVSYSYNVGFAANPHISTDCCCGRGKGRARCVALARSPRRIVKYACGALPARALRPYPFPRPRDATR